MVVGLGDRLSEMRTRVGSARSAADAELLWPLALGIDAVVPAADASASRELLWAVSDAIKAAKRVGIADVRLVGAALDGLERGAACR